MDGKTESQSSPPTTSSATGSLASPPPRTESDDNPPPLVAHGVTAPDAREDKQTHRNVQPQSAPSTPKRVIPPVHHVERSPVHANGTPPAVLQRSPRARSDFHLRPSPPTRRITSNPVLLSHTSPSTDVASIVAKAWQTTGSPATSSPRLGRPRVAVADKPALPSDYVAESIVAKAWRRDSEASQGSTGPVSVPEHWETFYVSLPFNIHTPKLGITVVAHRSLDGAGDGVAVRCTLQQKEPPVSVSFAILVPISLTIHGNSTVTSPIADSCARARSRCRSGRSLTAWRRFNAGAIPKHRAP